MQLVGAMETLKSIDYTTIPPDTILTVQSSFKKDRASTRARNLTELKRGESAILESIDLDPHEARRLMELGFLPGHRVTAAQSAPGGDPQSISGRRIRSGTAARNSQAPSPQEVKSMSDCHDCPGNIAVLPPPTAGTKQRVVAIVGPPNSGKSTLFNRLTGLRQKVANFPGVTVEHHLGKAKLPSGREVSLVDLPGIYSLEPRTEDERVTHDVLSGEMPGIPRPDAVLLILDSTNLGRHLVLAAPILSLGVPTMIALNMADDLRSRGGTADVEQLALQLGSPVALISAARGEGLEKIFKFLDGATADIPRPRADAASGNSEHSAVPSLGHPGRQ